MAHVWLLLKLRAKLSMRRYAGKPLAIATMAFALAIFAFLAFWIVRALVHNHAILSPTASRRLFDVTTLIITGFIAIGPLMGFRGNEFMDVSKLFQYPIRPTWVFVSTAIGSFLSASTLFFLPILLVPALMVAANAAEAVQLVAATLLYMFLLYAFVQCLTLLFLNVLRSRRFRDFVAVLAPIIGMASYLGLRFVVFGDDGVGRTPGELEAFLERVELGSVERFLPPLWYTRLLHGDHTGYRELAALAIVTVALCVFGVQLTIRAFHGDVAIQAPEERVKPQRAPLRRIVGAALPDPAAAVYAKELLVLRREPWFRMLFLQQLGLVVLICLGRGLWERQQDARDALLWAGLFLVYIESGFLLNVLGLEGKSIQQTTMLPTSFFRVLLGKNCAYLQVLALTNLILVPSLALLSSRLAGQPVPWQLTILLTAIDIVVLPVVVATGNLLSVLLPNPIGQRGRRVLGQERTGSDGCIAAVMRMLFSLLAMLPAAGVGVVIATPVIFLDQGLGLSFWAGTLPLGLLLAALIYVGLTTSAARYWQRNAARILNRLA